MLKKYEIDAEVFIIDYGFQILDLVAQHHTRWSIIFDAYKLNIHYKTFRNENIRIINGE